MSQPLLLDEMFSDDIAQHLRAKGYDVISVVADRALVGLPDDQVLAYATTEVRALVTANIKDFVPLDARYRPSGPRPGASRSQRRHCGRRRPAHTDQACAVAAAAGVAARSRLSSL